MLGSTITSNYLDMFLYNITLIDLHSSYLQVIEVLTQDFSRRQQPLFFFNLKPSVVAVFEGIKPKDFVVYYNEHQLDNMLLQHT